METPGNSGKLVPRISQIFGFMSGKRMPVSRLGDDFALKSCRKHDGDQPTVERSDTAG
jgi:hypothetical protein